MATSKKKSAVAAPEKGKVAPKEKGPAGTPEKKPVPLVELGKATRFKKGECANPNGRPKKIYTVLRKTGYSKDDIRTAYQELAFYTLEDLQALFIDPNTPIILKVVANALKNAAKSGKISEIRDIIEQVIGKPKQGLELSGEEGGPIIMQDTGDVDYSKLPSDVLRAIVNAKIKPID